MLVAWPTIKWGVVAAIAIYAIVQFAALRTLRNGRRRRGEWLFRLMLVSLALSQCISLLVDNRCVDRVAFSAVALLGVITSVLLVRLLVDQKHAEVAGRNSAGVTQW